MMRNFILTVILTLVASLANAQSIEHELKLSYVSIDPQEYQTTRFTEPVMINKKEALKGKDTSYKNNGEALLGKLLGPYVDYKIKSKAFVGTYTVTVSYRLDSELTPEKPYLLIGMDLVKPEEVFLSTKLIQTVSASFKTNLLSGKTHTVKIWLPTNGVSIQKVTVRRELFSTK